MATLQAMAAARFEDYLMRLAAAAGHADRTAPLRSYLTGLLLPGQRKSVEPMAARVDPRRAGARHQSLHHFVANSGWDDEALPKRDVPYNQLSRPVRRASTSVQSRGPFTYDVINRQTKRTEIDRTDSSNKKITEWKRVIRSQVQTHRSVMHSVPGTRRPGRPGCTVAA